MLHRFCAASSVLAHICKIDGYAYATDAVILLRRPLVAGEEETGQTINGTRYPNVAGRLAELNFDAGKCTRDLGLKAIPCDDCQGRGEIEQTIICRECGGHGHRECPSCGHVHDCRHCEGGGEIDENVECKTCLGSGALNPETRQPMPRCIQLEKGASYAVKYLALILDALPGAKIHVASDNLLWFTRGEYDGVLAPYKNAE